METMSKHAAHLCIILALVIARVTSYNPSPPSSSYKLGRISYYEEDPSLKSYRKRVADEPYRTLQSTFLSPQLDVDEELSQAGVDYMSLLKQLLAAEEPIPQRQQRSQQQPDYYPPPPPPAIPQEEAISNEGDGDDIISEADKDAFFKYLADNEEGWPLEEEPLPVDYNDEEALIGEQQLLAADTVPSAVVAKKPQAFLVPVLGSTFKPLPVVRTAAAAAAVEVSTTPAPTTTSMITAGTTSSQAKETAETTTTPLSHASKTEKSASLEQKGADQPVESSIVDSVKRFLLERHNQEMHKTKRVPNITGPKSIITSTKDLLNGRSLLHRGF